MASIAGLNLSSLDPLLTQLKEKLNTTGLTLSIFSEPYHDDLRSIHVVLKGLPEFWLLLGHCCFVSALYHKPPFRYYWLLSFWISFAAGFGGGTLSSILMQDPPMWLRDDSIILIFVVCWWFVMYSPKDVGFKLFSLLPIKIICKACSNILRAKVIMGRVDLVVLRFGSSAIAAPLFLGTLTGCGGRLICDVAASAFHMTTPAELAKPSWSLRSALSVSAVYVATVYWLPIFPHDVAQVLMVTFLVAQGVAADLTGMELDMTAPFFSLFHFLTNIPLPPDAPDPSVLKTASFKPLKNHE